MRRRSRMSSSRYCSTIHPDQRLRLAVLGLGALLLAFGTWTIAGLPLALYWRSPLLLTWVAMAGAEIALLSRAYRLHSCYRIYADGTIEMTTAGSGRRLGAFAAGSVVLPGIAWLRIRPVVGRAWGELIVGNSRKNKEWRRLQVICRLVGAC